ncbi:lasso peptide biosynthesis PqqD family chaperone [Micromonospora sp. WMMD1102]|uniref:lasso peptide biosynthesis PqqD family chaperone n=1 Tax=Micromonospora sp. WMMD1102 TaxID=3016105 RepID=UPI002415386E|nr:lasso peptide biosynthesis PqqD family chaperone [Micromonospora sp. WMMD1102]MDG4788010.1 lasso peptide biosynthesis PqqD family chaperone [Micromonospora sp. WMMD1102]
MTWKLPDRVSWTPTEYGGVLLDAASGEYWTLNPTGAVVLGSLLAGGNPEQAAARLAAEFDGDPAVMAAEVPELIAELAAAGLVVAG